MATRKSTRDRSRLDHFSKLPAGVQRGLQRFVHDNLKTVCEQVSLPKGSAEEDVCKTVAMIMKKEKLFPSNFLALYFDESMLGVHAALLGRSPKGNSTTLAERISNCWSKNSDGMFDTPWIENEQGFKMMKKRTIAEAYGDSRPYTPSISAAAAQSYAATANYYTQHGAQSYNIPGVNMTTGVPTMSQNFAAPQLYSGMAGQPVQVPVMVNPLAVGAMNPFLQQQMLLASQQQQQQQQQYYAQQGLVQQVAGPEPESLPAATSSPPSPDSSPKIDDGAIPAPKPAPQDNTTDNDNNNE